MTTAAVTGTQHTAPDWAVAPAPPVPPKPQQDGPVSVCGRGSITCTTPSMTITGITYAVQVTPTTAQCTCPHFTFRHEQCKHIEHVRNTRLCSWNSVTGIPQTTPGQCPNCGADTVTTDRI